MKGPILIQGAMDVETDWLVSQLTDPKVFELGGFRFWRGWHGGLELAVSRTGIGTIFASCATVLGIERFRPRAVVNQGIAGAHRTDLHVGDIVVGRSCIPIHDLKTAQRGLGEGCDPFSWEFHDHGDGLETADCPADPRWTAFFDGAPYHQGRKRIGRLGSGDVYNREIDRIHWLCERGGQDCEDMESIAAYQVCRRFGVSCVGLRIISNNELTGETYQRTVGETLQRFVLGSLSRGPLPD